MSRSSWEIALIRTLRRLRRAEQPARVAVVGVGQELRGDDAAGTRIARALQRRARPAARASLLAIDAGTAPENVTGALRSFAPDLVLIVDAAEMDTVAGTVAWLDCSEARAISACTHTLPLSLFAGYLAGELGCQVALLGIQPADTSLHSALSPAVRRAVGAVVRGLAASLT